MKKYIVIAMAIVVFLGINGNVFSSESKSDLQLAFEGQFQPTAEVEFSEIETTEWGNEPRWSTSWVKRDGNQKTVLSMINRNPDRLLKSADGILAYLEKDQIRGLSFKKREIKDKNGGFRDGANSTEISYYQLMELLGEDFGNLQVEPWNDGMSSLIGFKDQVVSFKVISPHQGDDCYEYRVFHIGTVQLENSPIKVIRAVEYYLRDKLISIQLKNDFCLFSAEGKTGWRENERKFFTVKGDQIVRQTVMRIDPQKRQISANFGKLDEKALVEGKP